MSPCFLHFQYTINELFLYKKVKVPDITLRLLEIVRFFA